MPESNKTVEMYIVESKYGTQANRFGQKVRAVSAAKGRKYFTVSEPGCGLTARFEVEPQKDANGNVYHMEVSEYTPNYVLYESYEGARDYLRRDALLCTIRSCQFDSFDVDTLSDIVSVIDDYRDARRHGNQ